MDLGPDGNRQHDLQLQLGSERQVLDAHQHRPRPAEDLRDVRDSKTVSLGRLPIRRLSEKDNSREKRLFPPPKIIRNADTAVLAR